MSDIKNIKSYKLNLILLTLSSVSYVFMKTVSMNDIWGLLKWILFFITVVSIIGLLVNIIRKFDKDLRNRLLFKVLLLILMGLTLLGVLYIGGLYTLVIATIYIKIFSKKVLLVKKK